MAIIPGDPAANQKMKVHLKGLDDSNPPVSKWAHPITELQCLTGTTVTGGITSNGNVLGFDRSVQQIPTSADVLVIAGGSFCPLVKEIGGTTQYADMYVGGATATQLDSNGNTGAGTLPTHEYDVVQQINYPGSAKNVPSEAAVAGALEQKQHVLSAGMWINIRPTQVADIISVNGTTEVRPTGAADHATIPTEGAVREAISAGDSATSGYALGLMNALHTTITNSNYATQAWVHNNFVSNTEYAATDAYGIVQVPPGKGLNVTDGALSMSAAPVVGSYIDAGTRLTGGTMGGVVVMSAIEGATNATQSGYAAVPTVDAVYRALEGAVGGKPVSSGLGITVDDLTTSYGVSANVTLPLYVDNTDNSIKVSSATYASNGVLRVIQNSGLTLANGSLTLTRATSQTLGGVIVPASRGLTINGGTIAVSAAVVAGTFDSATTAYSDNRLGGVVLMKKMFTGGADLGNSNAIAPSFEAIYSAYGSSIPFAATPRRYRDSTDTGWSTSMGWVEVESGAVFNSDYSYIGTIDRRTVGVGSGDTSDHKLIGAHVWRNSTTNVWSAQGVVISTQQDAPYDYYIPLASAYWDSTVNSPVVLQYKTGNIILGGTASVGGKPVSGGVGISATDAGTSYTLAVSYTSPISASGSAITLNYGTGLTTSGGALVLKPASNSVIGGVQVPGSHGLLLNSDTGSLTLASASKYTNYTGAATEASAGNVGGVVVMTSIGPAGDAAQKAASVVPSVDAVWSAISAGVGPVTAGYDGPFKVSSESGTAGATTVSVAGGYLKWLDGNTWVEGKDSTGSPVVSRWVLSSATYNTTSKCWKPLSNTELYLVGSSGAVAGQAITSSSYKAVISGATITQQTVSHTTSSSGSRYKWANATSSFWTEADVPTKDTPFYKTATDAASCCTVTTFNYSIVVNGGTYAKTETTPSETMGWYDTNGGVQYTAKSWPTTNDTTLYTLKTSYGYATSAPSLPPAGAFYTMLAQNQNGVITQQQHGTVWHEHWGDDYKGQFAICRMSLASYKPTRVPTKNAYDYKFIVGNGGIIYGCNAFSPKDLVNATAITGGVILGPGAFSYPDRIVGNATKDDGIYIPYLSTADIWLNIWYGVWPITIPGHSKHQTVQWQFVVTTYKLEGSLGNTYSVYLGWITPNGSPQQDHRGAITIRGRWG